MQTSGKKPHGFSTGCSRIISNFSYMYSGVPVEPEKLPVEKGVFTLVFHKKEIRFSGVLSEPEKHPLKKARSRLFFNGRNTRILK